MTRRTLQGDVGQLLRTVRERRGLSQSRLAARVGTSQQRLSQVERGVANPTLGDLERLFDGLGQRLRVAAVPHAEAVREVRVRLLDRLPAAVVIRLGDHQLRVPPMSWLTAHDPDLAELLARLTRAGWAGSAATASPAVG
ncbi:helix-turn-helix transcriptional regulator [Natronosporangium hydrolyticum]|uniref:Helix-turn-helix transcriptional regulator n=1 Tax=Natronosporangium hydrolyticum TaxID=2811111 RepID=A0A895YE85_9ACTN|nr:helix-turn-helix transcriptional regulator [Natronosporangium hydrolyticum]QSB14472.1 helix-turn-helix transcriptional regulator [Natronosporangium hydrolyticum]